MSAEPEALMRTPLHEWHIRHGARMGEFAGYDMPIRYGEGTLAEHAHTRRHAGLFDVGHMGVAELHSDADSFPDVAQAIERFVPCDVDLLKPGRQRYTQMLNRSGGIIDDLMISRSREQPDMLTVVSNAGRKTLVFAHLVRYLPSGVSLRTKPELCLLALQGPDSETVLARIADDPGALSEMAFMDVGSAVLAGCRVAISRSGYTGEDGFEIAVHAEDEVTLADALIAFDEVKPAGLGARDTLRLEAGLCLYGADIDETTSPVEAGLAWSIQKRRRSELGFPGDQRIAVELESGPARRLVGLVPHGKAPVRDHALVFSDLQSTEAVGVVTSGGFSPTLGRPIAVGYVPADLALTGTTMFAEVRGVRLPVDVAPIPFLPHNYRR